MPYITPEDETLIELIVQACRKLDGGGWSEVCRRMMSERQTGPFDGKF